MGGHRSEQKAASLPLLGKERWLWRTPGPLPCGLYSLAVYPEALRVLICEMGLCPCLFSQRVVVRGVRKTGQQRTQKDNVTVPDQEVRRGLKQLFKLQRKKHQLS